MYHVPHGLSNIFVDNRRQSWHDMFMQNSKRLRMPVLSTTVSAELKERFLEKAKRHGISGADRLRQLIMIDVCRNVYKGRERRKAS